MKEDPIFLKLQDRLSEVSVVSSQTLGPLTPLYKKTTSWVKTWPLRVLIPLAFLAGIVCEVILGERIIKLVSLLQHGF